MAAVETRSACMRAEKRSSRRSSESPRRTEAFTSRRPACDFRGRGYLAAKTNANFPGNPTRTGRPTIQGIVASSTPTTGPLSPPSTRSRSRSCAPPRRQRPPRSAWLAPTRASPPSRLRRRAACSSKGSRLPFRSSASSCSTRTPRAPDPSRRERAALLVCRRGRGRPPGRGARERRRRHVHSRARRTVPGRRRAARDVPRGCRCRQPRQAGARPANPRAREGCRRLARSVRRDRRAPACNRGRAGFARRRYAELADVLDDRKPGRTSAEEITLFDSTGTALESPRPSTPTSRSPSVRLDRPFLMPVEDVFSITGRGTVATGRIEQGVVHTGDTVEIVGIHPETNSTVVTGVEGCSARSSTRARPGDSVGWWLAASPARRSTGQGARQAPVDHPAHQVQGAGLLPKKEEGRPSHAVLQRLQAADSTSAPRTSPEWPTCPRARRWSCPATTSR